MNAPSSFADFMELAGEDDEIQILVHPLQQTPNPVPTATPTLEARLRLPPPSQDEKRDRYRGCGGEPNDKQLVR